MFCCFGKKKRTYKKKSKCQGTISWNMYQYCSPFSKCGYFFRQLLWLAFTLDTQPHASNFHFCPAEGSSETLGWSSGPMGLWTSESSTSVRRIEKEGAALPSPAHSWPQSASPYTPTCSIPQKSFQVLFWKGKKQKGKKSETVLFQALNSMALASLSSHGTTLPPSSLFLGVSLNLFFCVFFFFFFYLLSRTAFHWMSSCPMPLAFS